MELAIAETIWWDKSEWGERPYLSRVFNTGRRKDGGEKAWQVWSIALQGSSEEKWTLHVGTSGIGVSQCENWLSRKQCINSGDRQDGRRLGSGGGGGERRWFWKHRWKVKNSRYHLSCKMASWKLMLRKTILEAEFKMDWKRIAWTYSLSCLFPPS